MGGRWLLGAGRLLAAVLVVSASALPLLPALKGLEPAPLASGTPALQGSREKIILSSKPLVSFLFGACPSAERAGGTPSRRTSGDHEALLALPRALDPHSDQPAGLGTTGASGRATPGPAPSAVAEPAAHRAPKSQPASYVAGSEEEILVAGSPEIAATSPSQASPGPGHLGVWPNSSEVAGSFVTVHAPAPASLRISVTSGPTRQPAGAPPAPTTPVPTSGSPQLLTWPRSRPIFSLKTWKPSTSGASDFRPGTSSLLSPRAPEEAVSSAPQDPPVSTSTANMWAATEPLPLVAPGRSGLDTASPALTVGSGSPRNGLVSSLGPGPSGPSMLPLPSTAPSSQLSSLPLSSPPSSPSPTYPSLSPTSSSPPPFQSMTSPVLAPISPFTPRARASLDPSVSVPPSMTTGLLINVPSSPPALPPQMVTGLATLQWTVQPGPVVPASPTPLATLSLRCDFGLLSGCPRVPGHAAPAQSSSLPHPGQAASLQDSGASSPGPGRVTRSVTFRITNKAFSAALRNPASPEHQLLSENIRHQLEPVYHKAFSSFEGVSVLLFRPGSVAVTASLVFGGHAPGPSARDVLWPLYCAVKAAGQMLGNLSLDDSSLASDGSNLTDLALETIIIRLTAMRPFSPQLLVPSSILSVLLGKQILQQVTPTVSRFCKVDPLEGPLLLFSNADQWVGIYIEYKFQTPIGTRRQGLANHLARNVMDPTLQKSSITAAGEKAELVLYEVWLQILDQPFTTALKDKTSPESQELRGMLTRWLTTVLRPLWNFGQVVVEEFQLDPLTARVSAAFFRAAPRQALVQDFVLQGLHTLQEAEGLSVEMVLPDLVLSEPGPRAWDFSAGLALPSQRSVVWEDGDPHQPSSSHSAPSTPGSKASGQPDTSIPSYAVALIVLGLLLIALTVVLVLKQRACFGAFGLGALKPCPWSSRTQ